MSMKSATIKRHEYLIALSLSNPEVVPRRLACPVEINKGLIVLSNNAPTKAERLSVLVRSSLGGRISFGDNYVSVVPTSSVDSVNQSENTEKQNNAIYQNSIALNGCGNPRPSIKPLRNKF